MAKKQKGSRKIDRNRNYCKYYRQANIRERNKVVRLDRHLKSHPDDSCAIEARKLARVVI